MGKTWSLGRVLIDFPEGHPQHGLEAWMRRKRVGESLTSMQETTLPQVTDEQFEAMTTEERAAHVVAMAEDRIADFAKLLISWNFAEMTYAEDGTELGEEPVPATVEGIKRLDDVTFTELGLAYNAATTRVAPPLPQPSNAGEPSEAALTLPQEPL